MIIFLALWAAGVIFKVETPSGTLVVEVEGDHFETNLKGETLTIKDTSSDETYEITLDDKQVTQPLKKGDYEFVLETGSGLKVSTSRFEITGDENSRVTVRWEPRRRGNPEDSAEAGEERSFGEPLIQFCWCPAGKFTMGSRGHRRNEHQVDVTLTQGFWLGKTEVTQGQWKAVMSTTPWKGETWQGENYVNEGSDYPAVFVSWDDAMSFCEKLTEKERSAGRLQRDWEYTLPTEAQWEYACRAGTTDCGTFSSGDDADQLGRYTWFLENAFAIGEVYAHEVGKKLPNAWKLHEMHGYLPIASSS